MAVMMLCTSLIELKAVEISRSSDNTDSYTNTGSAMMLAIRNMVHMVGYIVHMVGYIVHMVGYIVHMVGYIIHMVGYIVHMVGYMGTLEFLSVLDICPHMSDICRIYVICHVKV